ncbi:hypothetical protein Pan97_38800 [Bremerella volcania]|uniref:Uncharacterized protein n=1 Tax=Bremerella volcania TaxID=2527984 RepID=A0A518CC72_9BACT|nr:hypothetical protein [Bremerella volcania]QDU76823.1 hypothetical protein Pan97_38800 [Bremerella volcania]
MDNSYLLIGAMARQCKQLVQQRNATQSSLPSALQPAHLVWMCNQIEEHSEDTPATKLHRWIGFVQCAMLAHGILDLEELKAMFDEAKRDHGQTAEDLDDLTDHLNPASSFEFEIGGEG